ncbi:hypothetical protein D3C72_2249300 [compost metagenome]
MNVHQECHQRTNRNRVLTTQHAAEVQSRSDTNRVEEIHNRLHQSIGLDRLHISVAIVDRKMFELLTIATDSIVKLNNLDAV